MTRRFGHVLLFGWRFLRRTRFGGLLPGAHGLIALLRVALLGGAWLLIALLRIARLGGLAGAWCLVAIAARCCIAMASLPVLRTRRARGFGGKVGWRHEAVDRHFRYLALN